MKAVSCLNRSGGLIVRVRVRSGGICTVLGFTGCAASVLSGVEASVESADSEAVLRESVSVSRVGSNVTRRQFCVVDAVGGAPSETVVPWFNAAVASVEPCAVGKSSSVG